MSIPLSEFVITALRRNQERQTRAVAPETIAHEPVPLTGQPTETLPEFPIEPPTPVDFPLGYTPRQTEDEMATMLLPPPYIKVRNLRQQGSIQR